MTEPTSSLEADRAGYTRQVIISSDGDATEFGALLKPKANIEGMFKAFNTDSQGMVDVDGATVMVREVD
jgi:hypothetical protein